MQIAPARFGSIWYRIAYIAAGRNCNLYVKHVVCYEIIEVDTL